MKPGVGAFERLPKWAQQEITRLNANVEYWKARATVGPENSDTFLDPYGDPPTPLGKRPVVEFHLGPDRFNDRIRVNVEAGGRGELYVAGGTTLKITPWATNVVKISTEKR